jgi:hypothetical protein
MTRMVTVLLRRLVAQEESALLAAVKVLAILRCLSVRARVVLAVAVAEM